MDLTDYLSPRGRFARKHYFMSQLLGIVLLFIVSVLANMAKEAASPMNVICIGTALLLAVATVVFSFFWAIRRLHDLGKSGWLSLLFLIPIVNFFFWLWLLFFKGDHRENEYGPPVTGD